jgi:hypothetical protein
LGHAKPDQSDEPVSDCLASSATRRDHGLMTGTTKITSGEMREMGVRGILIYCCDHQCSHSIAISADRWPDHVRLSDIEPLFVCKACGKRGADARPDFSVNLVDGLRHLPVWAA